MVVNERPVFAVTHGPNERSEHIKSKFPTNCVRLISFVEHRNSFLQNSRWNIGDERRANCENKWHRNNCRQFR
jgi:hypothetical protein